MKRKFLLGFFIIAISAQIKSQIYSSSNMTLTSLISPEPTPNSSGHRYSGCWGWYQQSLNKEYAIVCSQSGTYWVDVTIPATPTVSAYRVGAHNGATWREVKSYQNFCYVASDDGGTNRFQIFDMQYLPDSVHKVYDSQTIFKRGHALWVDGNKLYVSSVTYSNNNFSSMNVYSLANPANPVLLRSLDQDFPLINHVHDAFVRNDTVYASCGYQGLYVFKLTASNTFSNISSLTTYPSSGYNHSSALTPNGQNLVFCDEVPSGLPIKVANVTNLSNIQVLATINQFSLTTPHNPFVVSNQYAFVSSYQDGIQLFDISNPSSPFLAGYFDTYYQAGGNTNNYPNGQDYNGNWGAYPFLPSKTILALDMSNGLFVLRTHLYQNVNNGPSVSYTSQSTVCPGSSVSFSNTSSGATSYNWSFSGGTPATSTATNPVITYNMPGTYNVILSAFNGTSSSVTNGTIQVSQQIFANTGFINASCATCSNGVASIVASGGSGPYTYTWLPNGGNAATAASLTPGCYTVTVRNIHSCEISRTVCVSFNVGLPTNGLTNADLLVYPNPAKTNVTIEFSAKVFDYAVYNSLGQLVLARKNNQNKAEIDLSTLSKGVYMIEVPVGEDKLRNKLIIE